MPNRIILAPAWCDIHLAECWHGYNENTAQNYHLGDVESINPADIYTLGAEMERLKAQGYQVAHQSGQYILTQYNDRLTMAFDEIIEEPEQIDIYQDW